MKVTKTKAIHHKQALTVSHMIQHKMGSNKMQTIWAIIRELIILNSNNFLDRHKELPETVNLTKVINKINKFSMVKHLQEVNGDNKIINLDKMVSKHNRMETRISSNNLIHNFNNNNFNNKDKTMIQTSLSWDTADSKLNMFFQITFQELNQWDLHAGKTLPMT